MWSWEVAFILVSAEDAWGEVSFMPGAIGPTGHVHWDMRERFPWPFPEIHPRDTDASVKMKASVRASVAAVAT